MTSPQPVAEPVDEPQAALIATCTCGRRIWRLALDSARWRHDDGTVTCPPPDQGAAMTDTEPAAPTSYETGTAEAWLTVLDYVSRVAQAVEGGDWYYLADKADALERAAGALRRRVWDMDANRLDVEDPQTGKPLRGDAVMAVVRRNAGMYRASRALYPKEEA